MPHVMFGGLVHEQALTLARRLAALLPGDLDRVFFSESGSVAVEIAMKMAQQYWINRGEPEQTKFVAFKGGYHGDTIGAMAVSDPDAGMHDVFRGLLPEQVIVDLPADAASGDALELVLARHAESIAGLIVEPLVQGAGGMRFHDAATLQRLREVADRCGALLIFDEIFTGFGRTGSMFACEQAGVVPDIVTLSKALTGGTLPLAATVARNSVFEAFWSDDPRKALMHGPTYMGNALACAAANASLDLFEREPRLAQVGCHLRADDARTGAVPRLAGREGRAGQGRDRCGRDGTDRRYPRLACAVCRGGRVHPPVRRYHLSDAGLHH